MTGTAKARRRTIKYDIKGEPHTLTEFSAKDLADFEDFVLERRVRKIRELSDGMDETARLGAMTDIIKAGMQDMEVLDEMGTMSGIVFLLHKSLSYNHPDLTIDDVGLMLDLSNATEISAIIQSLGSTPDTTETELDPPTPPEQASNASDGDTT